MDKIDRFYNRLRNEAIDNEKKTQREAFDLLAKHISLMDRQQERKRALKTMTDAEENKIKRLVSEFETTIATIFQNYGKATFGGIGGLQTRYQNLASEMRSILQGPYDTDDKEATIKLCSSLLPKLRLLEKLLGAKPDSFTLAEKRIVNIIIANMEPKPGNGFMPPYEPLGSFIEILEVGEMTPKRRERTVQYVKDTSRAYTDLDKQLTAIIQEGTVDISVKARRLGQKLGKDTKNGEISALVLQNIQDEANKLDRQLEEIVVANLPPGTPLAQRTRRGRLAAAIEGEEAQEA
jgi:hypothetical protein